MGSAARAESRLQREGSEDMAAIFWKSAVSDNWNVAADWSAGAVPTSADDVTIAAPGSYTVTISAPDEASALTFDALQGALQENSGSLTVADALTVSSGLVSLNEANTIGVVIINGGTLAFGNSRALGAGTLDLSGAELLATANETLSNVLVLSESSTIAAEHGTTLTEKSPGTSVAAGSTLNIGALGQDGTIVWDAAPPHLRLSPPSMFRPARSRARLAPSSSSFLIRQSWSPPARPSISRGAALCPRI
jgi:hypothetical protein